MNRISIDKMLSQVARVACSRATMCVALLAAGLIVGHAFSPLAALGDVKTPTPPQSFQSGGQLAVPVLKEIAATLKQMDARISRIEVIAQQMRTTKTLPQPAN
jgi:hypothetical protein